MKQINIAMMEQVIEQYPQEFDELIADTFYKMVNGVNEKAGVYILRTIGTILENYASYRGRDKAPEAYEQRKKVLLGYLMKGLVHFKESISIEAKRSILSDMSCLAVKSCHLMKNAPIFPILQNI